MVSKCSLNWLNRFTSFGGRFYRKSTLGTWYTECGKALQLFCSSGKVSGCGSIVYFYSRLVESERDNILVEALNLDDNHSDSLFQRTFGPKTLENFQEDLYSFGVSLQDTVTLIYRAVQNTSRRRETALHAIIQCPEVSEVWAYAEHM